MRTSCIHYAIPSDALDEKWFRKIFRGHNNQGMARKRKSTTRENSLEAAVGKFVQQYARKRQRGMDPNDRGYDRKLEKRIRRMDPQVLDRLINDGADM